MVGHAMAANAAHALVRLVRECEARHEFAKKLTNSTDAPSTLEEVDTSGGTIGEKDASREDAQRIKAEVIIARRWLRKLNGRRVAEAVATREGAQRLVERAHAMLASLPQGDDQASEEGCIDAARLVLEVWHLSLIHI